MGVPYAAPPIGELRFRPPAAPAPWDEVRPCVVAGAACPQAPPRDERYTLTAPQDEDCLSLNVWTPAPIAGRRPVMLFLHGGRFLSGSSGVRVYDGERLAGRGVVAITCNFRFGAFGFTYLDQLFEGYEGSGNCGLLDIVAVLEWIAANVASFGGDPRNVTVVGLSSGATALSALLAMPRARRLFRRGVLVGGVLETLRSADVAAAQARIMLAELGVAPGDSAALHALPARRLIADEELLARLAAAGGAAFAPVLDGRVLAHAPAEAIARGEAAGIDLIIGTAADETGGRHSDAVPIPDALRVDAFPLPRPDPDQGFDVRRIFGTDGPSADEVVRVYRASLEAAGRPAEPGDVFAAAFGDVRMRRPNEELAEAHAAHHPNTYVFRFMWPSPGWDGALGAFHGLPAPFIFDNVNDPGWRRVLGNDPPQAVADALRGALVAFAESGEPGEAWERYDTRARKVMLFDLVSACVSDPDGERRRLYELANAPAGNWPSPSPRGAEA